MLKKLLAATIICLLIGLSIASSAVDTVEDAYDFDVKEIISPLVDSDKKFYAVDTARHMLVWFDPENPDNFNDIGPFPSTNFPQGGTFVNDVWWVCDTTGSIWTVDVETGATTAVGNSGTGELNDIEFDHKTRRMFGISSHNIYYICLLTGSARLIGDLNLPGLMWDISSDHKGSIYCVVISSDGFKTYSIDAITFNTTLLGNCSDYPIGEFGDDEGIMWSIGYNNFTSIYELWTINVTTWNTTFMGSFPEDTQPTCLSIPNNFSNQSPDTPEIEGQRRFKGGDGGEYPYTIYSTDPEDDDVYYCINWSDGTIDWFGPYESGEEITINVTIPLEKGTYVLFKVKAKDSFGAESDWGILEVTVPKSKNILLQGWLERFPILQKILDVIYSV